MSWDMATKGMMGEPWPVPTAGEIGVEISASPLLEVSLQTASLEVELDG